MANDVTQLKLEIDQRESQGLTAQEIKVWRGGHSSIVPMEI